MQRMMDVIIPLRVVELGLARGIGPQISCRIVVIFQHQVHVPLRFDHRAHPARQFGQDVRC